METGTKFQLSLFEALYVQGLFWDENYLTKKAK